MTPLVIVALAACQASTTRPPFGPVTGAQIVVLEVDGVGPARLREVTSLLTDRGFRVRERAQEIGGRAYAALGCTDHRPTTVFAWRSSESTCPAASRSGA